MPSISEILTQNSNDKVEIKSQVNLNGEAFKVLKQFIEQFRPKEQATIIKSQNIGGNIGIYGNESFGIYGTSIYGNLPVNGFVLGNELAGILGTSTLGNTSSEYSVHAIVAPNNVFEEFFVGDTFKDDSTTATWGSDSLNFSSGQTAISTSIDYNNGNITRAKLDSIESSGSFDYQMTADGINWEAVTNGATHSFSNSGIDLRWKASENQSSTGNITKIQISEYH